MKFTFLGTAAAEGMPAVFCNCKTCRQARKNGGKDIRTRSQSIINDEFLLDLPADTYLHFLQNGIEGHKIKYLFVTHSHQDHFYIDELQMRHGAFAHDMQVPALKIYCSKGAYKKYENTNKTIGNTENVEVTLVKPYERVFAGDYEVIPLPARHFEGDGAVIYIIKHSGKTVLYAHDTGYLYDEVFEYIENEKLRFDFITFDCTNINLNFDDNSTHMGFEQLSRVVNRFKACGAVDDNTVMYVNHFSHNGDALFENLEKRAASYGFKVSYDGLTVNI